MPHKKSVNIAEAALEPKILKSFMNSVHDRTFIISPIGLIFVETFYHSICKYILENNLGCLSQARYPSEL